MMQRVLDGIGRGIGIVIWMMLGASVATLVVLFVADRVHGRRTARINAQQAEERHERLRTRNKVAYQAGYSDGTWHSKQGNMIPPKLDQVARIRFERYEDQEAYVEGFRTGFDLQSAQQ